MNKPKSDFNFGFIAFVVIMVIIILLGLMLDKPQYEPCSYRLPTAGQMLDCSATYTAIWKTKQP